MTTEPSSARTHLAFERLAAAHTTSAAGDTLIAIALAGTLFFDVPAAEARTRVALYLLLTMAPFSLLAPLIGPALDRRVGAHRLAVVISGGARAALAVFMTSTADTPLLYPAAFGVLVLSRAHSVARAAILPATLREGEALVWANARLARLAITGGAIAAVPGILAGRLGGSGPPLVMAAIAFSLTALAGFALPRPRGSGSRLGTPKAPFISPIRVRRALIANIIIRGLGGFLLFLLAFGLRERGVAAAGFALVLAASGVGSFIGATAVPRMRRGENAEWVMLIALLVGGGAAIIASRDFGTDLAALLGGAVGMLSNAGRLAFDSIAQLAYPEASRGRAFARFETTMQLFWVLGALLPVVIPISLVPGLWLATAAFFAGAAWFLVSLGIEGRQGLSG